eukprot:12300446-Heterocapsa_arctica.AAC.1
MNFVASNIVGGEKKVWRGSDELKKGEKFAWSSKAQHQRATAEELRGKANKMRLKLSGYAGSGCDSPVTAVTNVRDPVS